MLQFDRTFFDAETRDDFYIESMMKRAWAVELEVLSQVQAVCKKYGLSYFSAYGTLLGAVRHKGFIPWDDDIDIALKRSDYLRLLQVLPKELPEGYVVESYYTSESHQQPNASVMNTRHILTDATEVEKYYGCPYICGIDIYPLDFISEDPAELDVQLTLYGLALTAAQRYEELELSGEIYEYLGQLEQLCGVSFQDDGTLRRQLFLLVDQIAAMYPEEDCDSCTIMSSRYFRGTPEFKFDKKWFARTKELPFENMTISVPEQTEETVIVYYGKNYMTPIKGAQGHEYPFYKLQEDFLIANGIHIR